MSNIVAGQKVPAFVVEKDGKTIGKGKYEPWSSEELAGQPSIFFVIAGHPEAAAKIKPLQDKLKESALTIKTVNLVNSKESPMGAAMFIKGEFKKSFKKAPENTYIHDVNAVAKEVLAMEDISALAAVINAEGEVIYTHEGVFGDVEVAAVIEAAQSAM